MIDIARRCFKRLLADESGATAIEYALIAAGVGATVAGVIYSVGSGVRTNFYDKIAQVMAAL